MEKYEKDYLDRNGRLEDNAVLSGEEDVWNVTSDSEIEMAKVGGYLIN